MTVVSIHNQIFLRHASQSTGDAANEAERTKVLSYREICAASQISLVQTGWDVYGAAGVSAQDMIRKVSEMIATGRCVP